MWWPMLLLWWAARNKSIHGKHWLSNVEAGQLPSLFKKKDVKLHAFPTIYTITATHP